MTITPLKLSLAIVLMTCSLFAGRIPYVRATDWRTSIHASVKAFRTPKALSPKKSDHGDFISPEITGEKEALTISVAVEGWENLFLLADPGKDIHTDHSAWVNARLIDADGQVTWLDSLKTEVGGWGQVKPLWKNKADPGYQRMAELVEACIQKHPHENTHGWEPTLSQGAGEKWVMEAREAFKKERKH